MDAIYTMMGITYTFISTDNQLYAVAEDGVPEKNGFSQPPQSQEHEYEFDNSINEYGAYSAMVSLC